MDQDHPNESMRADFTRGPVLEEGGDASASSGPPMRDVRPQDARTAEYPLRSIGLEPAPPPPLFDTGLGQAFFQMRTQLSVSVWDMARLAGTDPTVVANLEAGALDALPAWSELARIVETYGALTGTDTAPLLARLIKDYASTGPAVTQPITAHLPPVTPPAPQPPPSRPQDAIVEIVPYDVAVRTAPPPSSRSQPLPRAAAAVAIEDVEDAEAEPEDDARPRRRGRGRPAAWLAVAVTCAVAGLVLAARMQPRILYAAAWPLPQVVRQPLVTGIDWLVVTTAPRRDGLVWIDAGNPAWRKTDKLPEPKP